MKGSSSSVIQGLSAATELINKSVFCVDNLHPRVDAQRLSDFVRKLGVKVLSCYQIKPRRQRNEVEPIVDRSAFRLCNDSAYRERGTENASTENVSRRDGIRKYGKPKYEVARVENESMENSSTDTVSYTHLTLPTIYSV